MIQRILFALVGLAALAAAAFVAVFAAAFAIFALLAGRLGDAGAAGALAGIAAAFIALGGLAAWSKARFRSRRRRDTKDDPIERLMEMARERPFVTAGAVVAAALVAIRNPVVLAMVVKSFLDPKKAPKKR